MMKTLLQSILILTAAAVGSALPGVHAGEGGPDVEPHFAIIVVLSGEDGDNRQPRRGRLLARLRRYRTERLGVRRVASCAKVPTLSPTLFQQASWPNQHAAIDGFEHVVNG